MAPDERSDGAREGPGRAESELYEDVARQVALPAEITAESAIEAVMCALAQRLSRGEAHDLVGELPPDVRARVARCALHRDEPAEDFGRDELLRRVADHLGCDREVAELATRGVFAAVRDRLSTEEIRDVTAPLPGDLESLWARPEDVPLDPESARLRSAGVTAGTDVTPPSIATQVEASGALPRGVHGADAVVAVMCVLSQRVTGGEARNVAEALPEALRPLPAQCPRHRKEGAEPFGRAEFVRRVAGHLACTEAQAEGIARAVFDVVQRQLPDEEITDAAAQLPADIEALWRGDPAP